MLIAGRNPDHAKICADDLNAHFNGKVAIDTTDAETAVRSSQLVITTTPATAPLVRAEWLHPRLHITAMGSDQGEKNEIEPTAIMAADHYICDRYAQVEILGEWRAVLAAGLIPPQTPIELGQIITGKAQARTHDDDITICDLTGTGAQDTAIGGYAFDLLAKSDLGTTIRV